MVNSFVDRAKRAWNVFMNRSPTLYSSDTGFGYSYRMDRNRLTRGNERSILNAICTRIAIDCASIDIRHVKVDDDGRYLEDVDSPLNNCLSLEANIDQTSRAFIQDAVLSMLDEGSIAVVPVDTDSDPEQGTFKVKTMRVGRIVKWFPRHVQVNLYNDQTGRRQEVVVSKATTAIVENPLYPIMNESNSTMQRLVHKLNLLDVIDEQSSSGKLDLIIQLPYVIKGQRRMDQAEERRKQIEDQLTGSKYGIAYTDGTEHITQLNRPVENNLMKQIEYLMGLMHSQLGITQGILDGTADESTMLNYHTRIIEPILSSMCLEMKRKFLTITARSQKQSIEFFRDPFKLVPISTLAELGDKFKRNEILSSNEIRQIVGMKPSNSERADQLENPNIREKNNLNALPPAEPQVEDKNEELEKKSPKETKV